MRLVWAYGIESRHSAVVLPYVQASFEDLRSLTSGSRPPVTVLRLHSDKAKEFLLSPLSFEPACPNKERCKLSTRVRPTGQRARRALDRNYKSESNCPSGRCQTPTGVLVLRLQVGGVCAYASCHRVCHQQTLPHFGDVVVVHQALKRPPSLKLVVSLVCA